MDWFRKLDPFQFSLAPLQYEKIIAEAWPITEFKIVELKNCLGERVFESYAELDSKLKHNHKQASQIYGQCDGTGTDKNKTLAVYKAFSEAIERWACYSILASDHPKYGFDINPSSTGFACFPSLTATRSRENAINEAIERWCITQWWQGLLSIRPIPFKKESESLSGWQIISPFKNKTTVIFRHKVEANKNFLTFFGFATSSSIEMATQKAIVEMDRNRRAILLRTGGDFSNISSYRSALNSHDQRILFFSSAAGNELFEDIIRKTSHSISMMPLPRILIDREVVGPWSKYSVVWRCLFENNEPTGDGESVFFF